MALIRIENLVKRSFIHGQSIVVFNNFNLRVDSAELIGIYGPANSGKTTLLNLIAGLEKAESGTIIIDGVDITRLNDTQLSRFRHRHFGIVTGCSKLLAGHTALENIELALLFRDPAEPRRQMKAEALLERVGLREQGQVSTAELSTAEKKRLLIAKALVTNPSFFLGDILLDDLHGPAATALGRFLGELVQTGITVLLTTRSLAIARLANRIIRLAEPGSA